MSRPAADLAALLQPAHAAAVRFGQGRVIAWDSKARTNTVLWRGIPLHDLPVIAPGATMSLGTGDLVALLGWAPGGGLGTWWILGRVIPPGAAATFTGGLAFRTDTGINVAAFGTADTGDGSLWRLNYATGTPAVRADPIGESGAVALLDHTGTPILATDPAGGLARPSLPLHLTPTASAETAPGGPGLWPSTSEDDPIPLLAGTTPIWQSRITVALDTRADERTEAVWRLDLDGRPVTPEQTGPGQVTAAVPDWDIRTPGEAAEVAVTARAEGPGRIWITATSAHTHGT
jgi:hypothetical protein